MKGETKQINEYLRASSEYSHNIKINETNNGNINKINNNNKNNNSNDNNSNN